MPVAIRFRADVNELIREIDRFGAEAPKAEARALNGAIAAARREAVDRLATSMGLPEQVISKETGVLKATPERLEAAVVVTGNRIPAIKFNATQDAGGVSYTVGGRSVRIEHAFIGRTGAHLGVFRRARGEGFAFGSGRRRQAATVAPSGLVGRLPIFERRGPSAGLFFEKPEVFETVREVTEQAFVEQLDAELDKLQERGRG